MRAENNLLMRKIYSCAICTLVFVAFQVSAQSTSAPSPLSKVAKRSSQETTVPQLASTEDQSGTKNRPLIVEIIETREEAADKQAAEVHRQHEAANSRENTNLTGGLLLIAFVQAFLFLWQLWLMRTSARHTAIAATAAQASVNLARAGERAYLFVESVSHNAREWREGTAPFEWAFRITNHGRTPAIISEISAYATISDGIPTEKGWDQASARYPGLNGRHPELERLPPSYVLAPSASSEPFIRHGDQAQLSTATHDAPDYIKQKREHLRLMTVGPDTYFWLVGHVTYRDTYGVECISRFCFGIDQPILDTVSERGGERWNRRT